MDKLAHHLAVVRNVLHVLQQVSDEELTFSARREMLAEATTALNRAQVLIQDAATILSGVSGTRG